MDNKSVLIEKINNQVNAIVGFLDGVSENSIHHKNGDKWSIAENIIHLNKSVAPINMALNLPKFSFIPFGRAKSSLGNNKIIEQYKSALNQGGKASKSYVPNDSTSSLSLDEIKTSFTKNYSEFTKRLSKWSENDLDTYRLPHPLIGKITVRDMTYFTIYHLGHHLNTIKSLV